MRDVEVNDEIDSNVVKESGDNSQLTHGSSDKSTGLNGSFANDSLNRNFMLIDTK